MDILNLIIFLALIETLIYCAVVLIDRCIVMLLDDMIDKKIKIKKRY